MVLVNPKLVGQMKVLVRDAIFSLELCARQHVSVRRHGRNERQYRRFDFFRAYFPQVRQRRFTAQQHRGGIAATPDGITMARSKLSSREELRKRQFLEIRYPDNASDR